MAVTAMILFAIAKAWMHFGAIALLPWQWNLQAGLWGVGLGGIITGSSALVYRLWPAYRESANTYLELVLKPLIWTDLIWLGLLPSLSEELLFRGVMLPALGLGVLALVGSSLCFGMSHLNGWRQWPYAAWATTVGFALAGSAIVTNNLLVPVIAHLFTNWVSGFSWKLSKTLSSKVS